MKKLKRNHFKNLIEPFLYDQMDKDYYELLEIEAKDLITYNRLDIIYKLVYLRGINNNNYYFTKYYLDHIKSFNFGKFIEFDNPNKNSSSKFINVFKNIDKNIHENGFDENLSIIPLSMMVRFNGSHRVASSIFRNRKVKCIKLSCKPFSYNYEFFTNHLVNQAWLEDIVLNYITESKNFSVALIWPRADLENRIIKKYFNKIIYFKEIKLSFSALDQVVKSVYLNEKWLGSKEKNFNGSILKTIQCYKRNKSLKLIIFEKKNNEDIFRIKSEIRNLCNIDNHSIHTLDTKEEAIIISRLLLNINSIKLLNNYVFNKENYQYLNNLEKSINKINLSSNDFIISDKSSLFIYGINKNHTKTLLEIYGHKLKVNDKANNVIFKKLKSNLNDEIIYNPENYFWFNNIKFISINGIFTLYKNGILDLDKRTLLKLRRKNINSIFYFSQKSIILTSFLIGILKFKIVKIRNFLKQLLSIKI
ncbi:Hypothetical protein P9515_13981 [Prochlorococcus marinus str. MIT 9515]|uniref:Uncharacterized protein n=1 Tax=Prochlorococcus marinus (strain MIT 9515) TaxID=167542 RepID=A2BXU4_PROM5|nr:hypothetical protein [Prochlorococcus marinus]ABM72605.1 Hypothetical protein P9515_13981 [Prochlorococcus marinus str. MIT 9515]